MLPKKFYAVRPLLSFIWKRVKFGLDLAFCPEGVTPLQWITNECLFTNAGIKFRKHWDQVEGIGVQPGSEIKERVFSYFTIPVA